MLKKVLLGLGICLIPCLLKKFLPALKTHKAEAEPLSISEALDHMSADALKATVGGGGYFTNSYACLTFTLQSYVSSKREKEVVIIYKVIGMNLLGREHVTSLLRTGCPQPLCHHYAFQMGIRREGAKQRGSLKRGWDYLRGATNNLKL